ncbi:MAG: class 3 adenylate cyclase [Planctomycetota bacterium]|jgi:class 3 adenylate cyclase
MSDSKKKTILNSTELDVITTHLLANRARRRSYTVGPLDAETSGSDQSLNQATSNEAISDAERQSIQHGISDTVVALMALGFTVTKAVSGDPYESSEIGQGDELLSLQSEAKRALRQSRPIEAYDLALEALSKFPDDVSLKEFCARALAESGAAQKSFNLLDQIPDASKTDETRGLLASALKKLALEEPDLNKRHALFCQAHGRYLSVFHANPKHYWAGINAAALSALTGQGNAEELAAQVAIVAEDAFAEDDDKYWAEATLAETHLIRRDFEKAKELYRSAAEKCQGDYFRVASTLRNARLLLAALGHSDEQFVACFGIPQVVVFSGHIIDASDRPKRRFPAASEDKVRDGIRRALEEFDSVIAFSSAACGADIIFLEEVLKAGGEINIVLPFDRDTFYQTSVESVGGVAWRERYEKLFTLAKSVAELTDRHPEWEDVAYDYANRFIAGQAALRAKSIASEVVGLAVWDRYCGDGLGGTDSAVDLWRSTGIAVKVVDPLDGSILDQSQFPPRSKGHVASTSSVGIKSMLFGDFSGFSKLSEVQIPQFTKHALGLVADLIEETTHGPVVKNTWGDGLYFVFENVHDAGRFSLELARRVNAVNWDDYDLPQEMGLRIGLHAGPVHQCIDPVTGNPNFIGTNVSRTARIEPITPVGEVYASEAFAALVAAERLLEFKLQYVGKTPLAKNYGSHRLFHVTAGHPPKGES